VIRLGLVSLALVLLSQAPAWAQPAGLSEPPRPERPGLFGFRLPEILSAPDPEELLELDYGHNIRIVGDEEYLAGMKDRLDRLAALPAGAELLSALGASGHPTELSAIPLHEMILSGPNARPLELEASSYRPGPGGELVPGPGSGARIHINPDSLIPETTPEIVLGHELIHALHYHLGQRLGAVQTEGSNAGTRLEELRTIGTDGYEHVEHSENELRGQWNERFPDRPVAPIRTSHGADFEHGEGECSHCAPGEAEGAPPSSSPEDLAPPRAGAVQTLESLRGPR
jgi:NleD-like pathogen effector protein (putative zinc metallopeptidase)